MMLSESDTPIPLQIKGMHEKNVHNEYISDMVPHPTGPQIPDQKKIDLRTAVWPHITRRLLKQSAFHSALETQALVMMVAWKAGLHLKTCLF